MSTTNKIYFQNAPIKEVFCIFNFKENLTQNEVKMLVVKLTAPNAPYEIIEENPIISIQFVSEPKFVKGIKTTLKSIEGDKIVQLNTNSISIHRLGKYTKWSDFSEQVIQVLSKLEKSRKLQSISMKKINSFRIDSSEIPSEYFNYYPSISTNDDYFIKDHLTHLQLSKKLSDHSNIHLKFNNRATTNDYQNIVFEIWTSINLTKLRIYTNSIEDIKKSMSVYNNEMYKSFISVLKKKAKDMIK